MYKALLGPGQGFGSNHLGSQISLLLKTMYEGDAQGPATVPILWEPIHKPE